MSSISNKGQDLRENKGLPEIFNYSPAEMLGYVNKQLEREDLSDDVRRSFLRMLSYIVPKGQDLNRENEEFVIENKSTKQVISLDGTIILKWGNKGIQLTGYNLFKLLSENIATCPIAGSIPFE